jgi:hypothetical protein
VKGPKSLTNERLQPLSLTALSYDANDGFDERDMFESSNPLRLEFQLLFLEHV